MKQGHAQTRRNEGIQSYIINHFAKIGISTMVQKRNLGHKVRYSSTVNERIIVIWQEEELIKSVHKQASNRRYQYIINSRETTNISSLHLISSNSDKIIIFKKLIDFRVPTTVIWCADLCTTTSVPHQPHIFLKGGPGWQTWTNTSSLIISQTCRLSIM